MTDTRAALEERGAIAFKKWHMEGDWADTSGGRTGGQLLADFYEQESSSLKLLLSAIFSGRAHFWKHPTRQLDIYGGGAGCTNFPVELDSSGIPVLTPEIVEALEAAQ